MNFTRGGNSVCLTPKKKRRNKYVPIILKTIRIEVYENSFKDTENIIIIKFHIYLFSYFMQIKIKISLIKYLLLTEFGTQHSSTAILGIV